MAVSYYIILLLLGLSFMLFDQDVYVCQLLYHNFCCQDYSLWYLIKMFMAVSYYIITAAVRIILKIFWAVSNHIITTALGVVLNGI